MRIFLSFRYRNFCLKLKAHLLGEVKIVHRFPNLHLESGSRKKIRKRQPGSWLLLMNGKQNDGFREVAFMKDIMECI